MPAHHSATPKPPVPLGAGSINDGLTVMSFVVSLIGAVLLLAIVSFFRRSSAH
jgi:uncharacterized membrane protein YeaQ/YmgE (transglycosylase-associated protein family)